jgi:NDP-sugar pyrophosphorylase family protein
VTVQCVVLAGGLGTRLGRRTASIPKAMIPVRGEPFLRHQQRLLAAGGITDVLLCIGHLGDLIRDEVAGHSAPGLNVTCVSDGPELLGTAGALRRASALELLDDTFFVIYGDSYLEVDYQAVWRAFDADRFAALMTVCRADGSSEVPNARFEGGIVTSYRKGVDVPADHGLDLVDFGLSVLTRRHLDARVPLNEPTDLSDVFAALSADGLLQGYRVSSRFHEIGSEQGLADLESHLGAREAS